MDRCARVCSQAELLFELHRRGTSPEWGGTRTSGSHKVEAFKHFSTLWKELLWALHNAAEVAPVMAPVAAAAVELTAPNTKGDHLLYLCSTAVHPHVRVRFFLLFAARWASLTHLRSPGPRVYDKNDTPAYNRPAFRAQPESQPSGPLRRPNLRLADTRLAQVEPVKSQMTGSLWDQYWEDYRKKRARTAALPFEGRGDGPDGLYGGEYVGKRGSRQ